LNLEKKIAGLSTNVKYAREGNPDVMISVQYTQDAQLLGLLNDTKISLDTIAYI